MFVSVNPSIALGFRRPFTTGVTKSPLTITNNNPQPIVFKVKTTAVKLYCVRPNSGRVEPGETVDVLITMQTLKEEPPLNTKCKDRFLIQTTIITPDKDTWAPNDVFKWATSPEAKEEGKVFQQKLRVTYLPAEDQILEEEDAEIIPVGGIYMLDPTPPLPFPNFVLERAIYDPTPIVPEPSVHKPSPTPSPSPPPPALPAQPEPMSIIITRENPVIQELYAKFDSAQAEIERLKTQIAALSTQAPGGARRRTKFYRSTSSGATTAM